MRLRSFDRVYAEIDRDYAAIHRSRTAIFDKPSERPTAAELAEYHASVRRHADGSIDFDSYRKRASAFRGQEIRTGSVLGFACATILTLSCVFSLLFTIASTATPKPSTGGISAAIVSHKP